MKPGKRKESFPLTPQGIDEASAAVAEWLEAAGCSRRDILRTRIIVEEQLQAVSEKNGEKLSAELSFVFGWLSIRYGGDRFNPGQRERNEIEALSEDLLAGSGLLPSWRWHGGRNELRLSVQTKKTNGGLVMLLCILAAIAAGCLGKLLPEAVRAGITDYALNFLANGFMNLLNTFIGIMIFLSVITGICGFGSAAAFGKAGKLMITRFIGISFVLNALSALILRLLFPLQGGGSGSSPFKSVLTLIFNILPENPVKPFLEGNTLQIVFMAVLAGTALLLTGRESEGLQRVISQAQNVVMTCLKIICIFLPVFVFSSLVIQYWSSGGSMLLQLWQPVLAVAGIAAAIIAAYLAVVCLKLRVKISALLPKLMPDFLIGITTASSSAAYAATLEVNEDRLGIDPAFSRTTVPIGHQIFTVISSLVYLSVAAFTANRCGVRVDPAWWIILWFIGTLFAMATPPVSGGFITCTTLLMTQMNIPQEAVATGVTLSLILDFVVTGPIILLQHLETLLQADRLGFLNREILLRK